MTVCVICEDSYSIADGLPDYFVNDNDFDRIMTNPELLKMIYKFAGERVCIARLGTKGLDGIYHDTSLEIDSLVKEKSTEGTGYYAEVFRNVQRDITGDKK